MAAVPKRCGRLDCERTMQRSKLSSLEDQSQQQSICVLYGEGILHIVDGVESQSPVLERCEVSQMLLA